MCLWLECGRMLPMLMGAWWTPWTPSSHLLPGLWSSQVRGGVLVGRGGSDRDTCGVFCGSVGWRGCGGAGAHCHGLRGCLLRRLCGTPLGRHSFGRSHCGPLGEIACERVDHAVGPGPPGLPQGRPRRAVVWALNRAADEAARTDVAALHVPAPARAQQAAELRTLACVHSVFAAAASFP